MSRGIVRIPNHTYPKRLYGRARANKIGVHSSSCSLATDIFVCIVSVCWRNLSGNATGDLWQFFGFNFNIFSLLMFCTSKYSNRYFNVTPHRPILYVTTLELRLAGSAREYVGVLRLYF